MPKIPTLIFLLFLFSGACCAQESNDPAGKVPKVVVADKTETAWELFRGDAGSAGVAKSSLPAEPEVLWQFKVPEGSFESTPVIVQAKADTYRLVVVGDLDGKIFGLDLEDGRKRWEFKTEIGFLASPAWRDGKVYVGDIDGIFYCLDQNGKELWRYEADGEIDSSANFYKQLVLFGSTDSNLYALDRETGKLVWKLQTDDQIQCSITVAGNRAFVAGCDAKLHVIDLDKGAEAGNVEIESPTRSTPAVLGDRVFFGTQQGAVFGVDWRKIETDWKHEDPRGGNSILSSAATTKSHVLFGAKNRRVTSLNPETGEVRWTTPLKAKVDSSPVIVGDRVLVGSTDGRLYLLNLADGEIAWQSQLNGGILGSPAVAFDRIVIATDRGVVYCLGEK